MPLVLILEQLSPNPMDEDGYLEFLRAQFPKIRVATRTLVRARNVK